MNKTIVLATDHAGFELKEHVKRFLIKKGYDIKDFGALNTMDLMIILTLFCLLQNISQNIN